MKKDQLGRFIKKSAEARKIRSIRLTDSTYDYLKDKAKENNQSIADLIEQIHEDKLLEMKPNAIDKSTLVEYQSKALKSLPYGTQSKYYKDCEKAFANFIDYVLHGK